MRVSFFEKAGADTIWSRGFDALSFFEKAGVIRSGPEALDACVLL